MTDQIFDIYDLIAGYIDTHLNKNNYYLLNKKIINWAH